MIKGVLRAYREILERGSKTPPADEDFENMKRSRPRLIEWLHMEDYGIKVARENRISMEVIEAYAFPPIVKY